MKIKFLLTMVVTGLVVIVGCGQNIAPATATITASPTSITLKDTVDPYVDEYIYTVVSVPGAGSSASAIPMNGIKVTYNAGFALGQQANSTGIFAFLNTNGSICPSPCTLTTDSRGVSIMQVRFCTTIACQQAANIPIPSNFTAGQPITAPISYTSNINITSGSAAPAVVTVSIN
ncbi:MAG: hypothetical protein M1428_02885 [Deltaproteobacteria bacterium]|nr:hypothetical protein [Deltaproteobacteria bacterium]